MSFLLDTNACIAIINDNPTQVRRRLEEAINRGDSVAVPAVAVFELWYARPRVRARRRTSSGWSRSSPAHSNC